MPVVFDPLTGTSYSVAQAPKPGQSARSQVRSQLGATPLSQPKQPRPDILPAGAYPYALGLVLSERA